MNNILVISQDKKFTSFVRSIGIGRRQETYLIGDKLQKLLDIDKMTVEDLIKQIGSSYRDNIRRVLENQEIPKKQLLYKLITYFDLDEDYFKEKELENVIITDNGIVIGKYDTNERAIEVKNQLDQYICECHRKSEPCIFVVPEN